jgi:hypothetical protein
VKTLDLNRYLWRTGGTYSWTERLVSFAPPLPGLFLFTVHSADKSSRDIHHMIHLHYDHKDVPRTSYAFSAGNICEVRARTGKMSLVRCGDLIIRDDGALLLSCSTADAIIYEGFKHRHTSRRFALPVSQMYRIDARSSIAAILGKRIA